LYEEITPALQLHSQPLRGCWWDPGGDVLQQQYSLQVQ
jgi:uncharacterized lipoprotein YddW (UPF0748 family)